MTTSMTDVLKGREPVKCPCGEPVVSAPSKTTKDAYEILGCKCGAGSFEIPSGSIWVTTVEGSPAFFYGPTKA